MMWKVLLLIATLVGSIKATENVDIKNTDIKNLNLEDLNMEESVESSKFVKAALVNKKYIPITQLTVNWFLATQICLAQGLSLASVDSVLEFIQLEQQLRDEGTSSRQFWLSGTNLSRVGWYWFNTGSLISFQNWSPGEPNNSGGVENCLIRNPQGQFNDVRCDSSYNVICEETTA